MRAASSVTILAVLTSSAAGLALPAPLPAPRVLGTFSGCSQVLIPVAPDLELIILEANATHQEDLVNAALDSPEAGAAEDPYGVVLWPAAQVVASCVAALPDLKGAVLLELGAGTGLCSLTAAARGATAHATDYREEPLQLLRLSADLSGSRLGHALPLSTQLFDITADDVPLPDVKPFVVCAADLLYLKSTSIALACRCAEALRLPSCRHVIVGDCGRPGRTAFLDELVRQGVRAESAHFEPVQGWDAATPRHEFISSSEVGESPAERTVGLLCLTPRDLVDSSL